MTPERIPLARPFVADAEEAALARVLASGRYVAGPENARFEAALAAACGRKHALAVSSGSAALELALWALGIAPGDEVLVPAFGFPAAANAIACRGATPVPVEVSRDSWNMDVDDARARATERTRLIVSIDQFGLVADTAALAALAAELGVPVLADSACSLGGRDAAGVPGAGYGVAGVLSFHPRKVITTGEGGAVLTDDDALAAAMRELRNQGQRAPGQFTRFGTNARLSEFHAALGTAQMERLDSMLAARQLLAQGYGQRLENLERRGRLSRQIVPEGATHSYQTFALVLAEDVARDAVRARLADADIESGPATYAFHRLEPFAARARRMPVADALHERSLAIPLYIGMRSAELDRVAEALEEALA